jgi:hypothetical protein
MGKCDAKLLRSAHEKQSQDIQRLPFHRPVHYQLSYADPFLSLAAPLKVHKREIFVGFDLNVVIFFDSICLNIKRL